MEAKELNLYEYRMIEDNVVVASGEVLAGSHSKAERMVILGHKDLVTTDLRILIRPFCD